MGNFQYMRGVFIAFASLLLCAWLWSPSVAFAQDAEHGAFAAEGREQGVLPELPELGGEVITKEEGEGVTEEEPEQRIEVPTAARAPGEEENRWNVKINAAIRANYVFADSPESFLIKYRWAIEGQANSATAIMRGNAEINAEVEGFLAKWPTGECRLDVTIPKIPFDLTFRRSGEDKGSISLNFRQAILENWQSKCSFTDAPGARFETTGEPEKWLTRAIEKARPPLRSIIADVRDEETTTSFVINKEIIDDPPLGSVEIEGTGVVTVTPGAVAE